MSDDHPYSTLSSTVPADAVLSPDGTRLYVAGADGNLRVHDAATGALLATWDVGTQLGALDISPDGSFLMVAERVPLAVVGAGTPPQSQTVTTYKVSTADGSVQSFPVEVSGQSGPVFDVAILAGGEVVLTLGGQSTHGLYALDLSTGTYSGVAPGGEPGVLTTSPDRSHVLVAPTISSGALLYVYEQGVGVTADGSRGDSGGPPGLFNQGIQAISDVAGLVVQGPSLSIFDLELDWQFDLTALQAEVGDPAGLAFDAAGDNLYILSESRDEILQVSTDSWTIVRRFYVGTDVAGPALSYGNGLLLSADGTYFSVITASGVQRVENFPLTALDGTAGADTLAGTDAAEAIGGLGGDDDLAGGGGHDTIDGGDGNDLLSGGLGDDTLYGGAGNDVFVGGDGIDFIFGGEGIDTVDYSADADPLNPLGVIVNLSSNLFLSGFGHQAEYVVAPGQALDSSDHLDRITGVENVKTGLFADWIVGSAGANRIESGGGNDLVQGGDGDDQLFGEAGSDNLQGGNGNDVLVGGENGDRLNGGTGADEMTGGTGNDIYTVDNAGDIVIENEGEGTDRIETSLTTYSLAALPNVENLLATTIAARDFRGNMANNVITSLAGNDILRLYDGGDDTVLAGAGNDSIFFIGALTSGDVVNGEAGVDTLVLQGPYGALTLSANVTQIENISILGGGNTSFGDPGTNLYDYVLTTNDLNFAAGVQARINGSALLAGEDFTFDGSAETDAKYVVYGGKGVDTLTGGLGNDIFFFAEERFASGDTVNGGAGYNGMFLRGNYTIDFNAPGYTGLFTNIHNLTLTSATDERYARGGGTEFDYNLTLSNAIVKPGETLTISGTILMASETMILDASQESDGFLRLFGGKANDTLKGGGQADLIHGNLGADSLTGNGGADVFRFQETAESNSATMDQILDFTPGTDKIELDRIDANTLVGGDQAFSWIGSNAFSGSAGQLRAYEQGGTWFVEGDTNGDSVADLVIALTLQGPTPLSSGDFLL